MAHKKAPEYRSYDEVPFHRKRWFFAVSLLFCVPIGVVIGLSGDIFLLKKRVVMKYPAAHRILVSLTWLAIVIFNIIRVTNN